MTTEFEGYVCQHCGSKNTSMMVMQQVCFPSKYAHRLTRKFMATKEFKHMGTMWETGDIICGDCGRVSDGYGNHVTNLGKTNEKMAHLLRDIEYEIMHGGKLEPDTWKKIQETVKESE